MKKIFEKRFMFVGTLEEAEFNRVVCRLDERNVPLSIICHVEE